MTMYLQEFNGTKIQLVDQLANSMGFAAYFFLLWFCLSIAVPESEILSVVYLNLFSPFLVLLCSYLAGILKLFVTKNTSNLKLVLAPGVLLSSMLLIYLAWLFYSLITGR